MLKEDLLVLQQYEKKFPDGRVDLAANPYERQRIRLALRNLRAHYGYDERATSLWKMFIPREEILAGVFTGTAVEICHLEKENAVTIATHTLTIDSDGARRLYGATKV